MHYPVTHAATCSSLSERVAMGSRPRLKRFRRKNIGTIASHHERKSYLHSSTANKQFDAGNVARIVRRQKNHRLSDFIRSARTPERHGRTYMSIKRSERFLAVNKTRNSWRLDCSGADGGDSNPAMFQIVRPATRKRPHSSFRRRIYTEGGI